MVPHMTNNRTFGASIGEVKEKMAAVVLSRPLFSLLLFFVLFNRSWIIALLVEEVKEKKQITGDSYTSTALK